MLSLASQVTFAECLQHLVLAVIYTVGVKVVGVNKQVKITDKIQGRKWKY